MERVQKRHEAAGRSWVVAHRAKGDRGRGPQRKKNWKVEVSQIVAFDSQNLNAAVEETTAK